MGGVQFMYHELQNGGAVATVHIKVGVLVSVCYRRRFNVESILIIRITLTYMCRDVADIFRIFTKFQRDHTVTAVHRLQGVHVSAGC